MRSQGNAGVGPEQINATIGLIYDAALDGAAMPRMLTNLAALFNSSFADSFRRTEDYSVVSGTSVGLDDADYNDVFLGVWVKRNVWGMRRPVRHAGDVVTTREMTSVSDLVRSDMYLDYLGPRGLHEGLRLDIWAGEGWIEDISLLRPWSAGPYSTAERDLAHVLMPHLQRATAVGRRLKLAGSLAEAGLAALERLHTGVLLLDSQARVLHANRTAAFLLGAADGLSAHAGGLMASAVTANRKLRDALDMAAGLHAPPRSAALRLPRPSGLPALSVIVLPLRAEMAADTLQWGDAPAVLVCIIDPQTGAELDPDQLTSIFGLTPSEAALAVDLVAGLDVRDIAAQRGRSINTVRTHLARLMAKTETRRQSDLVRLLGRLPSNGHES